MRKIQRLAAVGALAGLTVVLGACGGNQEAASGGSGGGGGGATTAAPAETESSAPAGSAASGAGVTTIDDIFGPACDQVPTEGEGSAQGMVDDPVGTAASNNPLLTTLTDAVTAANLVDTLNDPEESYTVFAPANSAFEELPEGTLDQLLQDPRGQLTTILTYHVVPQRYDAAGLVAAGEVMTVQGDMLQIMGTPEAPIIDQSEQANVLCGDIPTANATVFVIDKVLMPEQA
ncbi:MAG: fasciclin domain-containing protein [Pseudonocardiaceae bacterium]|nr:fasciclin domain-containing protein [Pseudonocardiaceae bacterium]